jgi:hypothetical protein
VASFLLVHSPLVGPTTWSWSAGLLRDRGHQAVIPSLVAAAAAGDWRRCVDAAVANTHVDEPPILVGHSGAGPLLPVIADAMDPRPSHVVFVDAGLPPATGQARLVPEDFAAFLATLAPDGVLPPWSEWFGADVMAMLVPDEAKRAMLVAEMPRLPLRYFDGRVPMPEGWQHARGAYVLLSEPYAPDAAAARARGWPVVERSGAHLDIVTDPAVIVDALLMVTAS